MFKTSTATKMLFAAFIFSLVLTAPLAAEARPSYGPSLRAGIAKKLKLKVRNGVKISYNTTRMKGYSKRSAYSQRRIGRFKVMENGKTISRGTLDVMVTNSGKIRALRGTKVTFRTQTKAELKALVNARVAEINAAKKVNAKKAATTNKNHSMYYNGKGRTGYHYSGGSAEAYARGLQGGLW